MIKVIHTADIHFGMENYGKIDSKTGIHSRLLDFKNALDFCIDYTIKERADLFIFSGDAYKTAHPTPTQQKLLMNCLFRLQETGIPIVLVVGNHDNALSFGKAHSLELFNDIPLKEFHVISTPTLLTLETKNGPVQLVGIPWPTRNTLALQSNYESIKADDITHYIAQAVARIIQDFTTKLNPSIPAILAGHLTVSSGIFSGSEKRAIYGNDPVLMPSQLALKPFDYVALGHLHRYQIINQGHYPEIVYAGSIERIDFGERKEPKGFCVVSLEKNKTTHSFIEVPTRPFIQIEITLTKDQNQTHEILNELKKYTLKDAVIKILYHLPIDEPDSVDLHALQRACSSAHYIVGIIPLRTHITRIKRSISLEKKDPETLLRSYFSNKPELNSRKEFLIEKALEAYYTCQETKDPC